MTHSNGAKKTYKNIEKQSFLTPEMSLSLSQTSLVGNYLSFRTFEDIYFEIEVLAYDNKSHKISVEVVDYQPKDISRFKEQTAKAQVLFIHFKPLKWQHIERYLSSYTKSRLLREKIIFEDVPALTSAVSENPFSRISKSNEEQSSDSSRPSFSEISQNYSEPKQPEPIIEKITEDARIYFKDADFNLGFVAFSYKSKKLNETYNLKIENHFLLTEFNAIKSYFPKYLAVKSSFQ